ncbi:MAG: DUF3168 domain-containing protein [Thermomicrobiales bacterium]|nr:DUF3168 domain-containing protein [Thermomicrobiales bacterium]
MFGSLAAEQWIFQTLAGVSELEALVDEAIFSPYAPQGSPDPFLVFYRTGAEDSTPIGVGIAVAIEALVYTVAIVAKGNDKFALLEAARAAHTALHSKQANITLTDEDEGEHGSYHITCHRIGELPNDDIAVPVGGVAYVTLGGMYEIEVVQTA